MGTIHHHAIIVTSISECAEEARQKAIEFGLTVTSLERSPHNAYSTFAVCPDGSKELWPESDEGDVRRANFIHWLKGQVCPDHTSMIDWVLVKFGELQNPVVEDDSWAIWRANQPPPPGYQVRVAAELTELTGRVNKLKAFVATPAFGNLDLEERGRLASQFLVMKTYEAILMERVEAFELAN